MVSPSKANIRVWDSEEIALRKIIEIAKKDEKVAKEIIKLLNPKTCPICGEKLEISEVRARFSIKKCPKCGYEIRAVNFSINGDPKKVVEILGYLGLGFLIGILAYYFLTKIRKNN